MTKRDFLEQLKAETELAVRDLLLPVSYQKADAEPPEDRIPKVYLMRIPDGRAATKKAPYILHQLITGKDSQTPGQHVESQAVVRTIFCVYHKDEQQGGLALLTVMERLRIHLLERVVIAKRYELDLEAGLEFMVYPDDGTMAPYYAGEMVSTWKIPAVERSVKPWL